MIKIGSPILQLQTLQHWASEFFSGM